MSHLAPKEWQIISLGVMKKALGRELDNPDSILISVINSMILRKSLSISDSQFPQL